MNKNEQLIYFCKKGHLSVVNYLIKNGADVNAKDYNGDSVLIATIIAIRDINEKYSELTLEFNQNKLSVENDYLEIIKTLIKNGADINIVDPFDNYSPLQLAKALEFDKIVDFLTYEIYEQDMKKELDLLKLPNNLKKRKIYYKDLEKKEIPSLQQLCNDKIKQKIGITCLPYTELDEKLRSINSEIDVNRIDQSYSNQPSTSGYKPKAPKM